MKQAFGDHTEVMLSIAEMAVNLDPETVDMRYVHSPYCKDKYCLAGHAESRGIIPSANIFLYFQRHEDGSPRYPEYFSADATLTPKEIGYQILDKLKVKHI